jgi:hypothetical protein
MNPSIPGLKAESLDEGAIIAYTLSSAQTSTISAWSDLAVSKLREWPKDRPYLALHDLSNPGVGLLYLTAVEFDPFNVGITPTGRVAAHEIMAAHSGWPIVLALVVSTSLSGRLTRLRMADIISDLPKITSRTFFKRAAALEWLQRHQHGVEAAEAAPPLPVAISLPVKKATASLPIVPPIAPAALPGVSSGASASGGPAPQPVLNPKVVTP